MLGVCFGSQLLAEAAGRRCAARREPEIGWYEVELTPEGSADPLLGFLPERFESLQWHHYEWLLPPGAVALARSAVCLQAFRLEEPAGLGRAVPPRGDRGRLRRVARRVGSDDPGAVATGLDPEAIRTETAGKIARLERRRPRDRRALPAPTAA